MKIHELKINEDSLSAIQMGVKRAELRWNDRDYHAGDLLVLRWVTPDGTIVEGEPAELVRVTHVFLGGEYGLAEDWVMLSIERVELAVRR